MCLRELCRAFSSVLPFRLLESQTHSYCFILVLADVRKSCSGGTGRHLLIGNTTTADNW